ncbi:MAG: hypothetical protein QF726_09385, partial [Alphaproteobacteria bacterium]|nr:hypothetical protein [Alphaproteobacteria bacterium]
GREALWMYEVYPDGPDRCNCAQVVCFPQATIDSEGFEDRVVDYYERFDLALLFITHDLRVAAQICDRIAVMHLGKVVETGPTAEVFANPRDDYTKRLFEAAPGRGWQFGRIQSEA